MDSGICLIILSAARQAFVLTAFELCLICFLTSIYTDLHMSAVEISAMAVNARQITCELPY